MATNQEMGVRFSQGVPNIMIRLTLPVSNEVDYTFIREYMRNLGNRGHFMAKFTPLDGTHKVKLQFEDESAFLGFVREYYGY